MPTEQTYATHRRIVPGFHGVAFLCIVAYLGFAIWQAVKHPAVATVMQVILTIGIALIFWYARSFVLTVQDRLIRLEERLRLHRLLPSDLQPRIEEFTPGQLVAIRFASDAEVPTLARTVLEQGIRDREAIKRMITTWRADHLRA
ncbi:MAG: DUF6526 family protein [Gemmatimonadota bacterium]|nr:DUF6526 family protein [Gemmatimonadota bacterium]MDH4349988.1 DUF6526 family protein [Gemmatimonadota bacterium]MDH5198075.1 DUF6526 family protein [Gemmatimonadota bacterium]